MTRRQSLVLLAAALAPRLSAAPAAERALMGTRFAVTCHHPDEKLVARAIADAYSAAEEINAVASDYIADSELLSLSKTPPGTATEVSPLLFQLLEQARAFAEKSGGRFDPTIGPLTQLWRESRRRKALPAPEILARAKAAVGWKNLILDPAKSTVTFAVPGMRLDLGGIAKGQAADRMFEILKNHGIPRSSVTAGGDLRLGDPPPGQEGWKIGVRTFDKNRDSDSLVLANCGVSTSGDLQQFVEIDGVRYAHLIDPSTGLGLTRHIAATIIAPNATMSDALDTACCVADLPTAQNLCASLGAKIFRES